MSAFPFAAVAQAAGSVISSIFNKPKTITPRRQILSTVQGAREAGIHPLAALGSGAGYTQVGGSPNAGTAIGAGLEKLGMQLANQKTEQEINAIAADTEARKAQADLFRAQSRTLLSQAAKAVQGGPRTDDVPKPITWFGSTFKRDPKMFSSAQDAQDEYGDVMEQLVGIPSAVWSAAQKFPEPTAVDRALSKGLNYQWPGRYAR